MLVLVDPLDPRRGPGRGQSIPGQVPRLLPASAVLPDQSLQRGLHQRPGCWIEMTGKLVGVAIGSRIFGGILFEAMRRANRQK